MTPPAGNAEIDPERGSGLSSPVLPGRSPAGLRSIDTTLPEQTISPTGEPPPVRPGDLDRPGPRAGRREGCPVDRRRVRLAEADAIAHRDYEEKRAEYLAIGVARILDHRPVPAYHDGLSQRPDRRSSTMIVTEAQTYQTDLLPGFVLPLARLLRQGRRLDSEAAAPKRPASPPPGDPRLMVKIRRAYEVLFLGLFLFFLLITDLRYLKGWPVSLFLEATPLVAVATALTTHTIYRNLVWGLVDHRDHDDARAGLVQLDVPVRHPAPLLRLDRQPPEHQADDRGQPLQARSTRSSITSWPR